MASVAQICNLALSRIGQKSTIASIDEESAEARQCKVNFADVRDTLLGDFDWNFARRTETLALRTEAPPTGWGYAYSVPNQCVRFRGIWLGPPPLQFGPARWELASIVDASNNEAVAIFTNEAAAVGRYTRRIENSELFSRGFTLAMTWRLAEAIAYALTNKDSIFERVARLAAAKVAEGAVMDANEGVTIAQERAPDWIAARGAAG